MESYEELRRRWGRTTTPDELAGGKLAPDADYLCLETVSRSGVWSAAVLTTPSPLGTVAFLRFCVLPEAMSVTEDYSKAVVIDPLAAAKTWSEDDRERLDDFLRWCEVLLHGNVAVNEHAVGGVLAAFNALLASEDDHESPVPYAYKVSVYGSSGDMLYDDLFAEELLQCLEDEGEQYEHAELAGLVDRCSFNEGDERHRELAARFLETFPRGD